MLVGTGCGTSSAEDIQRSCEPHKQTEDGCTGQVCDVKKVLAYSEPSTHCTFRSFSCAILLVRFGLQSRLSF